jgi:hypothetical protein
MDLDFSGQTSVAVVFFATLAVAVIPPFVRQLWSKRRDNNVFTVSNNNTSKTCLRHRKECLSSESLILQICNFFSGGLLFGFLVLRLMPQLYHKFNHVHYHLNNSSVDESLVIEYNDYKFKKTLPYVELMFSGFFFAVYFLEQIIQVRLILAIST